MNPFTVSKLADGLWAIRDNQTPEDSVCYLLCGATQALLFDTGIGLGNICKVVANITSLPVTVVLSHWHHDHTGGAHTFGEVWAWPSTTMQQVSTQGISATTILQYEDDKFFAAVGSKQWHVPAFPQIQFLQTGQSFDLGGYNLQVLHTPGHTADSICLYEPEQGWLFTGDTAYNGPLFLQFADSSLPDYTESVQKLLKLPVQSIFPGHNSTHTPPNLLAEIHRLLQKPGSTSVNFPALRLIVAGD